MKVEPQKEHQWLHQLVGEWTAEGEATMEPGKPPVQWRGTDSVRSLGGLWTIAEGKGDMPEGGTMTSIMTLGYDPRTKRYVGTFIASMMTHMWHYEGTLDPAGKVLTLDTEGPGMSGEGPLMKYQDVIEIESPDHRILRSRVRGDDGKWNAFMVAHYRRRK